MAPPFQRHIFVCTNRRPDGHPKGHYTTKGTVSPVAPLAFFAAFFPFNRC